MSHLTTLADPSIHIRLLQTLPNTEDGSVRYLISQFSLADAPRYRAISYTWGSASPARRIIVNDNIVYVRENCFYALWQARKHFGRPTSYIWIDSVCIDQDNPEEKSAQVQIMGAIYARAKSVLACIGQHANGSEDLLETPRYSRAMEVRLYRTPDASKAREYYKAVCAREYWHRLWILQELYLANDIRVLCGTSCLRFEQVVDSRYHPPTRQYSSDNPFDTLVSTLQNKSIREVAGDIFSRTWDRHDTIASFAARFAASSCADDRDHIYGIFSIMTEAAKQDHLDESALGSLRVDYSLSRIQLAIHIYKLSCSETNLNQVDQVDQAAHVLRALQIDRNDEDFSHLLSFRLRTERNDKMVTSGVTTHPTRMQLIRKDIETTTQQWQASSSTNNAH